MSQIKKLLLVTDAWEPQVNGVVRTLKNTIANLEGGYNIAGNSSAAIKHITTLKNFF